LLARKPVLIHNAQPEAGAKRLFEPSAKFGQSG
jgi:hypothetical protein